MTDLDDRFRSFSRTKTPDLWREISLREPRTLPPAPPRRRALAIAVAFLIAAAGVAVVAITFGGSKAHRSAGEPGSAVTNGAIAYVSEGTAWVVQPDGSGAKKLTIDVPGFVGGLSWSPDGRRIVFDVNSYPKEGAPKGGFFDIYAANADGTDVVRLTHDRDARLPAWSPDGSRIAFTRQGQAGSQIYVMNVDGTDSIALTHGSEFSVRPTWSPDGSRIAFESVADGNSDVYVMNADGGGVTRLTDDPAADYNPVWSPDDEHIAFASDRSPSGIYVMRTDGSDVRLVEPDGDIANLGLAWSPNGRFLVFSSSRGEGFARAVYVLDVSSNAITQISGRGPIWGPSWQPIIATSATPSIEPLPPSSAEVVGTFQVGQDVRSVAYGEESVWVATSDADGSLGGRIVRIDPETHQIQAEIPVEAIPDWEVGGGAMVIEGGSLWVAGGIDASGSAGPTDAAVIQIDTTTNEVVQTIELGGTHGADLAFLDGALWVLLFGDESVDHDIEVVRVEPSTGDDTARIPLDTGWAHTIVAAQGRLVVLESGPGAANAAGYAAVIDPETSTVSRAKVPSEYMTPMPVVSRGQVWIALDPGFARLDPQTVAFPDPVVTVSPKFSDCCGFVEADEAGVWFLNLANLAENGTDRVLSLFDPDTHLAQELALLEEGTPVAMAVAPDAVWILNYEGTLTHVELG
jgi:dipeptidyl aminopeptidase/acylaminoacyl peptidase